MIRILSIRLYNVMHPKNSCMLNFMFAGLKPRSSKKSSQTVFNSLSEDYVNNYNA